MATAHDPGRLPPDLPVPQDDGAARHLTGTRLPSLALPATNGSQVDLSALGGRTVVYIFPRTGRPGEDPPDGWDAIPGARGCTPQSCSFRDHSGDLKNAGVAHLFGLSTQDTDYQREAVERLHLPFPLLSDLNLALAQAIRLPIFNVAGMTLLKRMVLIIDDGVIAKVFYPVFPPDKSADEVIAWLLSDRGMSVARSPGAAMAAYRLHYFPESGNSYKLALMLTLCGQDWEPVWTDFGGGVTRTAEWRRQVNEMGEIPVLEDSGKRHTQTAPILLRLAERYGRFGGRDDDERFEILRWLFWDNHKLTGYMATYRFLRAFTPSPDPNVLAFMRKRLDDYLGILERHFQDRLFVAGNLPTIADLSMIAYLSFPSDETGYDLATSHPAVQAWLARVAAIPGWRAPYDLLPGKRLRKYV